MVNNYRSVAQICCTGLIEDPAVRGEELVFELPPEGAFDVLPSCGRLLE